MIPGVYSLVWESEMYRLTECKVLMHVREVTYVREVVRLGLQLALLIL